MEARAVSRFDVDVEGLARSSTRWCKRCEHSQRFCLVKIQSRLTGFLSFRIG
jgi:hypothetical protein